MNGFLLLVGHMVGDYILQNDWMAANKANPDPGPCKRRPFPGPWEVRADPRNRAAFDAAFEERNKLLDQWDAAETERLAGYAAAAAKWHEGERACVIHCLLYTFAVWLCSCWWMPAWGLGFVFMTHYAVDRFGLAGRWMRNVSGQKFFASKEHPMWPNSIVIVDNTFHLIVLAVVGVIACPS